MDNKGRIIQEVARNLGHTQKEVLEVVSSQTALVKKAMQGKESTSVYLRQVGTFISRDIRHKIINLRKANKKAKRNNNNNKQEEEPLSFD